MDRMRSAGVPTPARSWQSVCGECVAYRTARCAHRRSDRQSDDCFAAVCEGFEPATRQDGRLVREEIEKTDL